MGFALLEPNGLEYFVGLHGLKSRLLGRNAMLWWAIGPLVLYSSFFHSSIEGNRKQRELGYEATVRTESPRGRVIRNFQNVM
jgi:hypothetical protein